jgi:hypothetical protein
MSDIELFEPGTIMRDERDVWLAVFAKTFVELNSKCLAACPEGCLAVLPWTEEEI